jgi:hypothetical protein
MTLTSAGFWNVTNANMPPNSERGKWHRVAGFSSAFTGGKVNRANTVCGKVYDFPTPNVVFSEQLGECTAEYLCQKGCYDGD